MSNKLFASLLVSAILALNVTVSAAADPSMHQVYQAAEAGNYREAQNMMDQVLRDHPNSAKAHFVEAELLAKQGKIASAKTELNAAERLEPGLPFAKPSAVQELNERLTSTPPAARSVTSNAVPATEPAIPWGLILVGMALLVAVILYFWKRQTPATAYQASTGFPFSGGRLGSSLQPYGAGGVGPMAPMGGGAAPTAGGMGSGILGGLATGAALGVGMVAGEALMHRVFDGGQHTAGNFIPVETVRSDPQPQYDMGGNDFGVSDSSSWDDSGGGGGDDWS